MTVYQCRAKWCRRWHVAHARTYVETSFSVREIALGIELFSPNRGEHAGGHGDSARWKAGVRHKLQNP